MIWQNYRKNDKKKNSDYNKSDCIQCRMGRKDRCYKYPIKVLQSLKKITAMAKSNRNFIPVTLEFNLFDKVLNIEQTVGRCVISKKNACSPDFSVKKILKRYLGRRLSCYASNEAYKIPSLSLSLSFSLSLSLSLSLGLKARNVCPVYYIIPFVRACLLYQKRV